MFFYLTTTYGPKGHGLLLLALGFVGMHINFIVIKDRINYLPYLGLMVIFFFTGLFEDLIFIHFDIIKLESNYPPIWFPTLWMVFVGYYGDVFNRMMDFPIWLMSLLGAIGGSLAYYRALMNLNVETHEYFYIFTAIVWAFFMPFSLKYFKYFRAKKIGINKI
jgi:hypothetical protein